MVDEPVIATADESPLEVYLKDERALRVQPSSAAGTANLIGGHSSNTVGDDVAGATIGGGGFDDGESTEPNQVRGSYGTIGGGRGNIASGGVATVAGGWNNTANGNLATVGGGTTNQANGFGATVGGGDGNTANAIFGSVGSGLDNTASGWYGRVGGGNANTASGNWASVDGGLENTASGDNSTVGGGENNKARGQNSTISGGVDNAASGRMTTVAGGLENKATVEFGTVGGGTRNEATNRMATVGGGASNVAADQFSTVSGGRDNEAQGVDATVPGGVGNQAQGRASFAGGSWARASHNGAFVWGDDVLARFESSGKNSFNVRATGGARFVSAIDSDGAPAGGVELAAGSGSWSSFSDRNAKSDVNPVDPEEVLASVVDLPVNTWSYESESDDVRHMGPMAQDFHATFSLGHDETRISTVDADGVAFAAIQGLADRDRRKNDRIEELDRENEELNERLTAVEARLASIEGKQASPVSVDS